MLCSDVLLLAKNASYVQVPPTLARRLGFDASGKEEEPQESPTKEA